MPDPALLTPLGIAMRDSLPPVLRDDPDYLGVLHAGAREMALAEDRLATLRAQLSPLTADELLGVWEGMLGLPIEPVGRTLAQRRDAVMSSLVRLRVAFGGSDWVAAIERIIPGAWSYVEHDPDVPGSPPARTVRIVLTEAPGFIVPFIRAVTPSNTALVVEYDNTYGIVAADFATYSELPLDYYDYADLAGRIAHGNLAHYLLIGSRYATYAALEAALPTYEALREEHV